ncbi:MAG: tetratricopeptide repeat protein [Polyangiales bacterium]
MQRAISVDRETSVFVGRVEELARVRKLLRDKRFVTVVGPTGIGKSRLLRKYVLSRRGDPGELVSCDLRDARDVDAMLAAIVLAAGGEKVPTEDGMRAAERVLCVRGEVLLVLDNVEPLLPLAAIAIQRLLAAAPSLRVLAGSRSAIGLDDQVEETVVELTGLDVERAADLVSERIREGGSDRMIGRASLISLARKLGGVPLAIELAAGRFGRDDNAVLSRLSGLPDRYDDERAVQRAIDRAWTLLDEEERELLGEASVFRGGVTLERLISVSDLGPRASEVAIALARRGLFEIVEADPIRLVMAESVRAHAAEIVESNGRTRSVRMRHLRAFDASPGVGADRENMRSAISFACAEGLHDVALRLLLALDDAPNRGDLAALDQAIEHTRDPLLLARALGIRSSATHAQGKLAESKRDAETSLALARQAGDEQQVAIATRALGLTCFQLGDLQSARACFERALVIERTRGHRGAVAMLLQNMGAVLASQGDLELARIHHESALALAVEGDDAAAEARATIGLGSLWLEIGDLGRARSQYERGLAQARRLRMTRTERIVTGYLGILEFDAGRFVEAENKLRTAASACGDAGDLRVEGIFEGVRGAVLAALDRLGESRGCFQRAESALARNAFFAEVIAIHRGHLDLAEARKAEASGDHALAEANRVYARLRVLDAHDPSTRSGNVTEPPIILRSDDARIAVRILERAIAAAE